MLTLWSFIPQDLRTRLAFLRVPAFADVCHMLVYFALFPSTSPAPARLPPTCETVRSARRGPSAREARGMGSAGSGRGSGVGRPDPGWTWAGGGLPQDSVLAPLLPAREAKGPVEDRAQLGPWGHLLLPRGRGHEVRLTTTNTPPSRPQLPGPSALSSPFLVYQILANNNSV